MSPPPTSEPPLIAGLGAAAGRAPHAAALFLPEGPAGRGAPGWRAITNAQLWQRSRAIAAGLGAIGLTPGDRVVLLVPPSASFFALVFGMLQAGVVPVLVDPGIGRTHLATCLQEADPKGYIGTPKAHLARLVLRWARSATHQVVVDAPRPGRLLRGPVSEVSGTFSLEEVEARGAGREPAGPVHGTAAILFTSGSTGPPKGVEYTHNNFAAQITALRGLYDLGPNDVQLATFPPFALFGPALGMATVVPRMDPTRPADVEPSDILEAVRAFAVTVMFGSPALLDTVSSWAVPRALRLHGLRLVMSAGAPVSRRIVAATSAMLDEGARLVTPYGATEALPVASVDHAELLADEGIGRGVCVGRPAPGVDVTIMRVTDDPVNTLQPDDLADAGHIGEIVVRGPVVTGSYFARPAATAAAKTSWEGAVAHRMGDLGFIDAQGRLWFCGRKAHRIHTASGPVDTVPVESVFNAHPWVARSALIGVGSSGHQTPCLCVEPSASAPSPSATITELRALADQSDVAHHVAAIRVHPRFPVDIRHNAKIDYDALRHWWRA